MFGSGFTFGFGISDVMTQISGLTGNVLVIGLVTGSLAIAWAARLVLFAKRVGK